MDNIDRALAVLEASRRPGEIRIHPYDAVEALAKAGLIMPDLPEPNDPCIFLFVPDGKGWMTGDPEALGPIVWTAPNSRIMVQQIEPGNLTPDEARGVAYALLAAANYSEEA